MLDDRKIRDALIKSLLKRKLSRDDIFEEIAVRRGLGVADVLANFNTPHCYEIKSDIDSLTRLSKQAIYFSQTFKKATLITTDKHILKAEGLVPDWWGIIIAKEAGENVTLKVYRKSNINPMNVTENLLTILWNDELKFALRDIKSPYKESDNRATLVRKLASSVSQKIAQTIFVESMRKRQSEKKEITV